MKVQLKLRKMEKNHVETNQDTFTSDIFYQENIEPMHCPTERMIADFFTKPLQGALCRKMRDIIMGLSPFPVEECVEKNHKNATMDKVNNPVKQMTYADALCHGANKTGDLTQNTNIAILKQL
jgi:hypothetical protein